MDAQSITATRGDGQPEPREGQPSPRRLETKAERHARRLAFGATWAPIARALGAQARARRE